MSCGGVKEDRENGGGTKFMSFGRKELRTRTILRRLRCLFRDARALLPTQRIAHVAAGVVAGLALFYVYPVAIFLWLSFVLYEIVEAWFWIHTMRRPDKVFKDILEFTIPLFALVLFSMVIDTVFKTDIWRLMRW